MPSKWSKIAIETLLILVGFALASAPFAESSKLAQQWIAKMQAASRQLSYDGVFIFQLGQDQRTVKVSHQVDRGRLYERISYQDGPINERIRTSLATACHSATYIPPNAADYYQFETLGETRIAGRSAYKVRVRPKDRLRFGYIYGIDQQTDLLLESRLMSQADLSLEYFKYVDIHMASSPDDLAAMVEHLSAEDTDTADCIDSLQSVDDWVVNWLPLGFTQVSAKRLTGGRYSMVYTDGLAVFSVLIDEIIDRDVLPSLRAQIGATQVVAINQSFNDSYFRIAVSGQLPQATANEIARSVAPVQRHSVTVNKETET